MPTYVCRARTCVCACVRAIQNKCACVCTCVRVCVCVCVQGIAPAVLDCLPSWQFDDTRVVLRADPALSYTDHPTALNTTLQQLQAMQTAPGATCVVEPAGWKDSTVGLFLGLSREAVPQLAHVRMGLGLEHL